jgi:hypothetical protein
MNIRAEIHTTDTRFPEGRDGRRIVEGAESFRTIIKTTGRTMVTFVPTVMPRDSKASCLFTPVEWIV